MCRKRQPKSTIFSSQGVISDLPSSPSPHQEQGNEEAPETEDLPKDVPSSPGLATEEQKEIVITSIRGTNLVLGLRRMPAGFHAVIHYNDLELKTENIPVSVNNDIAEWRGPISIPSDLSATVSLMIHASFKFQPILGHGEPLRRLTVTVNELLDRSGKNLPFTFSPKDGDVVSPCSSLLVTVTRRKCEINDSVSRIIEPHSSAIESGSRGQLVDTTNQGHRALSRYRKHGQREDLERAIEQFQHALNICPLGHPCRAAAESNMATAKFIHYRGYDANASLEILLVLYRNALAARPVGHPDRPSTLIHLAGVHLAKFEKKWDEDDRTQASALLQEVKTLSSTESHELRAAIFMLHLYVEHTTGAVQARSQSRVERYPAPPLTDVDPFVFSDRLLHLFKTRGDLADLQQAISTLEGSMRSISRRDSRYLEGLMNLGSALLYRFHHLGDLTDLEEAISRFQDTVNLTPNGHPEKLRRLKNLGTSFLTRFHHLGEISDLEEAISREQEAVHLTPNGHPDKRTCLSNLGNSFLTRFHHLGEISDLEEAISRQRDAVDLTPNDHPDKLACLNNLGVSFKTRFEHLGEIRDLEEAILRQRDAVNLAPNGHPGKPRYLNTLGTSFKTRFERLGEIRDLEEAIMRQQDAVDLTPNGHLDKPGRLDDLGNSLRHRFERLGEIRDLEDAILRQLNAIDLAPNGHPQNPGRLNNLGNSFKARFESLGEIKDLEEAISKLQDAVDITPNGHPTKPSRLNNLGNSFLSRFHCLGEIRDLEEGMSRQQEAVNLTPSGHPDMHSRLSNLGISFLTRFQRLGQIRDLEDAISRQQKAVDLVPNGHPQKLTYLRNLGVYFLTRSQRFSKITSLQQAIIHFSLAACAPAGPVTIRFDASQGWIFCARLLRHESLLHAYSVAVNVLPQLAWIGLSLAHRYRELVRAADVVRDAAAAALDSGRPETAVEWLEQGRSVVWGELLQLRSSYDDLASVHPDHAHRLRQLSSALEHAGSAREKSLSEQSDRAIKSLQSEIDKHRKLAIERDRLLEEIRRLPGFERFLLHKEFSQLRASAHSGPIVILNASKFRCDALIVLANVDHVIHVPLPNFTFDRSKEHEASLKKFVRDASKNRYGYPIEEADARADEWKVMLASLWKCAVKPVLDALAFLTPGDLSRIFWCPTGPLTFLPIHAAGFYDDARNSEPGHKVYDFVISSYIPTLSILAAPSTPTTLSGSDLRLLAVPQPPSDGLNHLEGVITELEHIKAVISNSSAARTTLTESSAGTVEEVLTLMKEAHWVHFACHGIQDDGNPTNSGLCLANERRLKISDIVSVSRPRGGLAFLSACQTAKGDKVLSDEAIHIAAGMLFAGYGGVVGTMWSIGDRIAPMVAKDVYEHLFRPNDTGIPDYREAAEALHLAVGRLRQDDASFEHWLPFIHVGL